VAASNSLGRWVGSVSRSKMTETLTWRFRVDDEEEDESSFHERWSGFSLPVCIESKVAATYWESEDEEDVDMISFRMDANVPMAWWTICPLILSLPFSDDVGNR